MTKGLQDNPDGILTPFPYLLASRLPASTRETIPFNAIGGPCLCFELFDRHHTMVYFCGDDPATLETTRSMLCNRMLSHLTTKDVKGVEECIALKNAYAMGVVLSEGIADREIGGLDEAAAAALCAPGAPEPIRRWRFLLKAAWRCAVLSNAWGARGN